MMVWRPDGPTDHEQDKIAPFALQYLHGITLDLGVGDRKVWPFVVGVANGSVFGAKNRAVVHAYNERPDFPIANT